MVQIHPHILQMTTKSYAREDTQQIPLIDCSLGVNPYGIPPSVMQSLSCLDEPTINQYPHDSGVIDRIIQKYQPVVSLKRDNVALGNGSYDLLCKINRLFLNREKTVLGYLPQFSAYVDDVHFIGANYTAYKLRQENGYTFKRDEYLECFEKSDASLLCLENPNNPTGQIIPLEDIEYIVAAAQERNVMVLVDEAYGDYMPLENSASTLVNKYNNLAVTRTFSKAYGLAGIRIGYLIGSREPVGVLKKVAAPYDCNSISRVLASKILEDGGFCSRTMSRVQKDKQTVINSICKLKVAKTNLTTPIMLLYSEEKDLNLYEFLYEAGIDTICGLSFDNLGPNSVRMMMCNNTPLLIQLLAKVEEKLK